MQITPTLPGTSDAVELEPFEALPTVAEIESDTYCPGCGYNLRGQPVRRDPRTAILLCRCCECGRYREAERQSSAGNVWLQRLGKLALGVWILCLIGALLFIGFLQLALIMEMSFWAARIHTHRRRDGNVESDLQFIHVAVPVASLGLGYLAALIATIALPHWRRAGYLALCVGWPASVAAAAAAFTYLDLADAMRWATLRHVCYLSIPVAVLGGVLGTSSGRPLARLLATFFVTPRVRPALDYLWRADGLELPKGAGGKR